MRSQEAHGAHLDAGCARTRHDLGDGDRADESRWAGSGQARFAPGDPGDAVLRGRAHEAARVAARVARIEARALVASSDAPDRPAHASARAGLSAGREPGGCARREGERRRRPFVTSPAQNGLPVLLVPCSSTNAWLLEFAPLANTSRMAPPALPICVGSPTRLFGLFFSLPLALTFRLVGSTPGFASFTVSDLPRMVCSAANPRPAAHATAAAVDSSARTWRISCPPSSAAPGTSSARLG